MSFFKNNNIFILTIIFICICAISPLKKAFATLDPPEDCAGTPIGCEVGLHVVNQLEAIDNANGIALKDNLAYVADEKTLQIVDISNASAPKIVNYLDTGIDYTQDLVLHDNYAYVVDNNGFQVIDISNVFVPKKVNNIDISNNAQKIIIQDNYAYLADWDNGLQVLDISNASTPKKIGNVSTPDRVQDVSIQNDKVYLASSTGGLRVIDVSTPSTPEEIGYLNASNVSFVEIALQGNYAYVANDHASMQVININDPSSPQKVGSVDTGYLAPEDIVLEQNYAYVSGGLYTDVSSGLQVFDISSPSSPVKVGGVTAGNNVREIVLQENRAYLASDAEGVLIVDISRVTQPEKIGSVGALDYVHDASIKDNYAYVADTSGLQVIDVSNPTNLEKVGNVSTLYGARNVSLQGDYAYIASGTGGLKIINISDPSSPQQVNSTERLPDGIAKDVSLYDNYACVLYEQEGLQIIDISSPSMPEQVGKWETSGNSNDISLQGDKAYLAHENGFLVVDISTPSTPGQIGKVDISASSVSAQENYAYVTTSNSSLKTIKVRDPSNPEQIGSADTPGGELTVQGNYAYVATENNGLQVIDVSSPSTPEQVNFIQSNTNEFANQSGYCMEMQGGYSMENVTVQNNYAYVTAGINGLVVIDISNPSVSMNVASLTFDSDLSLPDIEVDGGYAYVAREVFDINERYPGKFQILDISTPSSPNKVGNISKPPYFTEDIAIQDNYAYVADGDRNDVYYDDGIGLQVIDISNHSEPKQVASVDTSGVAQDVVVQGDYAYVADGNKGLKIININSTSSPDQIASVDTSGVAQDVVVQGDYAYVADGNEEMQIININNPLSPEQVVSVATPGVPQDVVVQGDYAYVANGNKGLQVIDINTPTSPEQVDCIKSGVSVRDVEIQNDYAFVAVSKTENKYGFNGLQVIDISSPSTPKLLGELAISFMTDEVEIQGDYAYGADGNTFQVFNISQFIRNAELIDSYYESQTKDNLFKNLAKSLDGKTVSGDMVLQGSYSPEGKIDENTSRFKWILLKNTQSNEYVAKGMIAPYGVTDFSMSNILWMDMSTNDLATDWSDILAPGEQHKLKFVFYSENTSNVETDEFTLNTSENFTASIHTNQTMPVIDNTNTEIKFTANIQGGESPYTYEWTHPKLYLDGMSEKSPGTGKQITTTPEEWGLSAAPLVLKVTDNNGKTTYARKLVTLVDNYNRGNPASSGSGSTLVRGVDVAQGNLHQENLDLNVRSKGPDFALSRSYNSKTSKWGNRGWQFNYEMKIRYPSYSHFWQLQIRRSDGRIQEFFLGDTDSDKSTWYPANPGSFEKLVRNNTDWSHTLYTKGSQVYHFQKPNSKGYCLLSSIEDRDGNKLQINYDSNDNIQTITDAAGRTYDFRYTDSGKLKSVTDFAGRSVSYTYDNKDRLKSFTNVRNQTEHYTYLQNSTKALLTTIKDPRENIVKQIAYDNQERAEVVTDALGNNATYHYASDGTVVEMPLDKESMGFCIDDLGRITQSVDAINYEQWKDQGGCGSGSLENCYQSKFKSSLNSSRIAEYALQTKTIDPLQRDTEYDYSNDGKGDLTKIKDAKERSTQIDYESSAPKGQSLVKDINVPGKNTDSDYTFNYYSGTDNIKEFKNPLDYSTGFSYTTEGQLKKVTPPKGNALEYKYNIQGYVEEVIDPKGNSITYSYDDLGRVKTVTDKKGYTTEYEYDQAGNIKKVINAKGYSTTYSYDENGNLASVTDPKGNTIKYDYNDANKIEKITYTVDGKTYSRSYEYDDMGRLTAITNENNNTFERKFNFDDGTNGVHRVDNRINPLSEKVTYDYTQTGKVKSITDNTGSRVIYYYDKLDRVTKVENDLGHYVQYDYNDQGMVDTYRDMSGNSTYYSYNDAGKLNGVKDANNKITNATYDKNGNLETVTDPQGHITHLEYDQLDRLVRMEDAEGRVWEYDYDANDNLVNATLPGDKVIHREYNALGRVTKVKYPDGRTVTYTYDKNGNRASMTDSVGTTTYEYNSRDRLTSVNGPYGRKVGYDHDGVGHVEKIVYPGGKTVSYNYDDAERMKEIIDWLGQVTEYNYKSNGVLKNINYGNGASVQMDYDSANRLEKLVNKAANGNVISSHDITLNKMGHIKSSEQELPLSPPMPDITGSMSYDQSNRLESVAGHDIGHDLQGRITSSILEGKDISYTFNSQDLITKIASRDQVLNRYRYNGDGQRVAKIRNGKETRYVLDVNKSPYSVLAEMDAENNMQRYYVYGTSGLVSQITPEGESHYYHYDPSGNTLALTDGSGEMSDSYAYTPYGETKSQGDTYNPFKFVGKYGVMDDGNGLHHMRSRYYDPTLKRFLSIDPVKGKVQNPQSLNQYAYVRGNPVNSVDPRGKFREGHVASFPKKTREVGEGDRWENKDAYGFVYNSKKTTRGLAAVDWSSWIHGGAGWKNFGKGLYKKLHMDEGFFGAWKFGGELGIDSVKNTFNVGKDTVKDVFKPMTNENLGLDQKFALTALNIGGVLGIAAENSLGNAIDKLKIKEKYKENSKKVISGLLILTNIKDIKKMKNLKYGKTVVKYFDDAMAGKNVYGFQKNYLKKYFKGTKNTADILKSLGDVDIQLQN